MNLENIEVLFASCENDKDRIFVAYRQIHEALLNVSTFTNNDFVTWLKAIIRKINEINYSTQFLPSNVGNNIISDLARLIHVQDIELSTEFSWLLLNFLNKQTIILENDVEHVTSLFLQTLKSSSVTVSNVSILAIQLRALATILYGNVKRLKPLHGKIISELRNMIQSTTPVLQLDLLLETEKLSLLCALMQCLENISADLDGSLDINNYLDEELQELVIQHFLYVLQKLSTLNYIEDCIYYKTVASCLRGLKNIMDISHTFPADLVGHLISIIQRYSVLGHFETTVVDQSFDSKTELVIKKLTIASNSVNGTSTNISAENSKLKSEVKSSSCGHKQKHKKSSKKSQTPTSSKDLDYDDDGNNSHKSHSQKLASQNPEDDNFWAIFDISDSDVSDGELNQSLSRTSRNNFASKIRTLSLSLLYMTTKFVDKKTMFGHWHSIFPDRFICNWNQLSNYPLFVIIIKDPLHKMRLAALSILTHLLDGSKQYLMVAEDGAQYHNVAYTPFSVSLGNTIKELHRCLLLTLTREQVPLVLVQAIKCLGILVANSPYHRLKPGLLNRSVRYVSHFLSHKDANIKVVALTCLGKVVSVHAPLGEVIQVLGSKPSKVNFSSSGFFLQREKSKEYGGDELEFCIGFSSGSVTPSSRCTEPGSDTDNGSAGNKEMSWLLKSGIDIIMSGCKKKLKSISTADDVSFQSSESSSYVHVLPVRVEALQVLTLMTQNYFFIVRSHLKVMQDLACTCLQSDPDNSIQLHAMKLLEALTSSMLSNQSSDKITSSVYVSPKEALDFWDYVLNGPIQKAFSNCEDSMVEMAACECLGNIGPEVFEKLSWRTTEYVKTVTLGFTSVINHHVSIGALSAVGKLVNYPCLSKDALFLADVANAILQSIRTSNLAVVTKAAWVFSNLSDAFVLNRMDDEFTEKISDNLLLKLLVSCIHLCSTHDKPRSNSLRTIGNLLNFLPPSFLDGGKFDDVIKSALQTIIKFICSGGVKVQWNACYALGNIMWNEPVLSFVSHKMAEIYKALVNALKTSKNFKVRISAAVVLAIPSRREMFFRGDESKTSARIFSTLTGDKRHIIGRTEDNNQASSIFFYRYVIKKIHPGNDMVEMDTETEFGMMQSKETRVGCHEDCFGLVWEGVLSTMLECESSSVDFTEMKYKNILMSKLTVALLHLLSLVVPGDLDHCYKSVQSHKMIKKYLQTKDEFECGDDDDNVDDKAQNSVKEDVAQNVKINNVLKEVAKNFSKLPNCASLDESNRNSLEGLSIFFLHSTPDMEGESTENNAKSKFFQVYD